MTDARPTPTQEPDVTVDRPTIVSEDRPPMAWGSDAIAELLGTLDLPYLSFNPGASYRGLHDSLVNYAGNSKPQMIQCLHEEHAVAVAHGYAKVTGKPMAVALHSNVGLMHATMAIFNAYCDRMPMVMIGATGPVDAAQRRPWIEWLHTSADQAALIRNYCKWDDQPGSVEAALESLVRADLMTRARPSAPTYVTLDAAMQEEPLAAPLPMPALARFQPPTPPAPPIDRAAEVLSLLRAAERPLVLMGRVGRTEQAWARRVALMERLDVPVLTDLKVGAVFPTRHRLHPVAAASRLTAPGNALLRQADTVLSLDWMDLGGTLASAGVAEGQTVISCTNDMALHNGWSKDHFQLAPSELALTADPDLLVDMLLDLTDGAAPPVRADWPNGPRTPDFHWPDQTDGVLQMPQLSEALRRATGTLEVCWTGLPLGWLPGDLDFDGPLDYLGRDGGGGIGAGPGLAVGASLALAGTGRIPVAVLGDGDFLMGSSALWTAAHHRLPLLIVVANNQSFFNDEVHQQRVAERRGRPVENRWVGQHIRDPDPDLAALARSFGFEGHGPVRGATELDEALAVAVEQVRAGRQVVVDVRVSTSNYQGASPGHQTRATTGRPGTDK